METPEQDVVHSSGTIEAPPDVNSDVAEVVPIEDQTMQTQTTQTTKRRVVRKPKAERKERPAPKPTEERAQKTYELIEGIPDNIGKETVARQILRSISAHRGTATYPTILSDLPKGTPLPTLRFYLGKFQRAKIVKSKKSKKE